MLVSVTIYALKSMAVGNTTNSADVMIVCKFSKPVELFLVAFNCMMHPEVGTFYFATSLKLFMQSRVKRNV